MKSQPPCTGQVLLGVFIVGQLFFLFSANLIGFLNDNRTEMGPQARQAMETVAPGWPEEKGHLWYLMDHLAKTDKMWAQVTGQLQPWSLFAPAISRECIFPAVEYHWNDDARSAPAIAQPLTLLSANNPWHVAGVATIIHAARHIPPQMTLVPSTNEPADLEHYVRIGGFRVRRYENNLVITLKPYENETPNETNERWSDKIRAHVTDYAEIILGYLRWRVRRDTARWPGREQPRQVILVLRRYHINDYDDTPPSWTGPYAVPIARWQPAVTWDSAHRPVEWYDPVAKRFKSLRK